MGLLLCCGHPLSLQSGSCLHLCAIKCFIGALCLVFVVFLVVQCSCSGRCCGSVRDVVQLSQCVRLLQMCPRMCSYFIICINVIFYYTADSKDSNSKGFREVVPSLQDYISQHQLFWQV